MVNIYRYIKSLYIKRKIHLWKFTMDNLTKEQRHKNMQNIRSKDTSIELALRRILWSNGIRYRKNVKKLPGKPDIVISKHKIAIFCDSEFWHGKDWKQTKSKIKSNTDYWYKKIENNMKRDQATNKELETQGWTVLRFWGCDIKNDTQRCLDIVLTHINK